MMSMGFTPSSDRTKEGAVRSLSGHFQSVPSVPAEASAEYAAKEGVLRAAVDRALASHPRITVLLGDNPLSTMEKNHRNHHRFLTCVFRLDDYLLLSAILPWVYRSYHAHGFSYDYFPEELRAWKRALLEHLSPEAERSIGPVYDRILEAHPETIRAADRIAQEDAAAPPSLTAECRRLLQHLLTGEDRECIVAAIGHVRSPGKLQSYYMDVLQPALREIGRLWECGRVSVAQEHLATGIAGRVMASLYAVVVTSRGPSRGRAVVACAPGEHHEVGSRMLSDLLELDGWRTWYLGANTPPEDILPFLSANKPDLFCLSVCMPYSLDVARDLLRSVRSDPALAGTRLLVGGQAFFYSPDLWKRIGADAFAADAVSAVVLAGQGRRS
jgi:methanogenic corrinoid protein MtbC1